MRLRRPCKNPYNNVDCELTFIPNYRGKLCPSCYALSRLLAHEKRRRTWETKKLVA